MNRFRDIVYRFQDKLPQDRKERLKILIAVPLTAICAMWILYWLVSSISFSRPSGPPNTPGFKIAQEISTKFIERHEFLDVGFVVVTEQPLRFTVVGAVHSPEELEALKKFLQEVRPENDYDLDVTVIPEQ